LAKAPIPWPPLPEHKFFGKGTLFLQHKLNFFGWNKNLRKNFLPFWVKHWFGIKPVLGSSFFGLGRKGQTIPLKPSKFALAF